MRVRSAALWFIFAVAVTAFSAAPLRAQDEPISSPEPEASPSPAPAPSAPAVATPDGASPSPGPAGAPAADQATAPNGSPAQIISPSGAASIVQAYPLDYRSVVDRLTEDPNNPALLNELGNLLLQHGRPNSAIAQYERAVKIEPGLAIVWNNLGVAYTASGKYSDGESAYRRALRINGIYALAYYNLGANFDQREKYDDAINYYQRAIELDPTLLDVRINPQIATNRHIPAILVKSYIDKGGAVVMPVQSMYPPKTKKKSKP